MNIADVHDGIGGQLESFSHKPRRLKDEPGLDPMDLPTTVQVFFCVGQRHETALFRSDTPANQIKGKIFYYTFNTAKILSASCEEDHDFARL